MKTKKLLLAIVTFTAINLCAQNQVCFTNSNNYIVNDPIVSYPYTVNDFNNDGLQDSAYVNYNLSYISIFLLNNNGVFNPAIYSNLAAGSWAMSIICDDFNGDGKVDLVVSNYPATCIGNFISVFLGDGQGNFGSPTNISVSGVPDHIMSFDFNSDGKPDLAMNNNCGGAVTVLLNTIPFVTINASSFTICKDEAVILSATGATSYTWTGGIINNTSFTPSVTSTYTVTGVHLGCSNTSEITIVVNPLPTATFTTKNESYYGFCDGSIKANLTYGTQILWNDSSAIDSISSLCPNVYTINLTDTNNCTNNYTQTILQGALPSTPSICVVKVDSTHTYNVVTWVKAGLDMFTIDSFIVYRETSTNTYTQIGFVLKDSLSTFNDYVDPSATGYRYKLKSKSLQGVESEFSDYHNTIHLTNTGANFLWTPYLVENNTTPVSIYNIYRDDNSDGNFQLIGYTTGNQFGYTVGNFSSFPYASYYVEAVTYSSPCNPSRSDFETSLSNIRFVGTVGINQYKKNLVTVYPNPTKGIVNVTGIESKTTLFLYNIVGDVVISKKVDSNTTLDISALNEGIYTLSVNGVFNKIIKN